MRVLERLRSAEFFRSVSVLVSGNVIAQLATPAMMWAITRFYSTEELGIYGLFMSVVNGLFTIAALRYDLTVMLPESDDQAAMLVRVAQRSSIAVALLATAGLMIFGNQLATALNAPKLVPLLWLAGVVSLFYSQVSTLNYWLNRKKRYGQMSRNKILQGVATPVVQTALGPTGLGSVGLVAGNALAQLLAWLRLVKLTSADLRSAKREGISALHLMRRYRAMPLMNLPSAIADTIRVNGINVMISALYSVATLGQFTIAWMLLQAPSAMINRAITQVFFQRLATTRRGAMLTEVIGSVARSAAIGIVPFMLIHLFAEPVVDWYTGGWRLAGQIAAALAPWLFVQFITSPISNVFIVTGHQFWLMAFSIVFAAVPLGLLGWYQADILPMIEVLSWTMAGMLLLFIGLAAAAAWRFDHANANTSEQGVSRA